MDEKPRCPDCGHYVSDHDMYGCTLYACERWPRRAACTLTGEFLLEYLNG